MNSCSKYTRKPVIRKSILLFPRIWCLISTLWLENLLENWVRRVPLSSLISSMLSGKVRLLLHISLYGNQYFLLVLFISLSFVQWKTGFIPKLDDRSLRELFKLFDLIHIFTADYKTITRITKEVWWFLAWNSFVFWAYTMVFIFS